MPVAPKYHLLLASYLTEPHPTDQRYLDLQKSLNLNIASLFINTLASSHFNNWHHIGGPITLKIDLFFLNTNHWRSVKHTQKALISCKYQGVKYTGINISKKHGRPYLLSFYYEINLITNSMQSRLVFRYTTLFINCHRQTQSDNAVSRYTINLVFWILQPKVTKIHKIQQGT